MKVEIKIVKARDFLKTKASGELNLKETKKLLAQIAELHEKSDFHEILVDVRQTTAGLNLSDIYELVTELSKYREAFRKKVAILLGPNNDVNKARFLEMCAQNRGYQVNIFTDFERAVKWLMR
jgi:hypothetical protein